MLSIPDLEEYILMHQRQLSVERYMRKDNLWVTEAYKADEVVELVSIGFSRELSSLYQGAEWFFAMKEDLRPLRPFRRSKRFCV